MTKSRIQLPLIFSRAVLSIAFLASFSVFNEAKAICTGGCLTGIRACLAWCNAHNKTNASQFACSGKCADYWLSGKNPQSIGLGDPTNPPEKIGPGRLKNPPTTVSDPAPPSRGPIEPVKPVKPVSVSNPNPGNNAPVILLRQHDSGGHGQGHK